MAEDKKNNEEEPHELKAPERPEEITPENAHLVDYDNLKVRLVCLVSQKNKFQNVANFLSRRGWEVLITDQVKEALSETGTSKPDFVLVSMNHPHPKLKQFPKIISQTFNAKSIAFGEETDARTMSTIQASAATFKIMGNMSGPMALRKIKQILQSLHDVDALAVTGKPYRKNAEGEFEFRLKDESSKNDRGMMIFEKEKKDLGPSGYNPYKDGKGPEQNSGNQSGIAYNPNQEPKNHKVETSKAIEPSASEKITTSQKSTAAAMAEKQKKDKEDLAQALKELGSEIGSGSLDYGEDSPEEKSDDEENQNKESAPVYVPTSGPKKEKVIPKFHQENTESQKDVQPQKDQVHNFSTVQSAPVTDIQSKIGKDGLGDKLKETSTIPTQVKFSRSDQKEISFLEEATIKILDEMVADEHEEKDSLGVVQRMGVLSIGHQNHKGYFMIAGHDIGLSLDDFVEEFKKYLAAYCQGMNHKLEIGEYINMDCPSYDFFINGEEGLEFCLVSRVGKGEVGVKYIEDEDAWPEIDANNKHEKSQVKAQQIVEDEPLAMDLFVHLERNKKFYKIVGENSALTADRKERLIKKETQIFIDSDKVGAYRKYQAQNKARRNITRSTKKKAS